MEVIELRDYQRKAVRQLKNGSILCGGVGSGKSRTALAYYYIRNGGDLDKNDVQGMAASPKDLYVITTARKRDSLEWQKEMVPFLITTHGEETVYNHKVVIDSWNNVGKYKDVEGAFFIFDEDRVVGNGAWVNAFLKIARGNEWILLSATPGDKYEDYIPVFIANGFYRNRTEFKEKHLIIRWNPNGKYPVVTGYRLTRRLNELRDSILVDMDFDRPTVSHHENVVCEYDRNKYKGVMKERWNPFTESPVENISELCYCLRRIVNCDQSREVKLLELFEKHPRLIIFYNLNAELDILRRIASGNGIKWGEWNGQKHEPVPESESWMYFAQYTAASEAWNCIATDTIIFYSQTYSYKTLVQAAGRIDRMNTPYRDLWYFHLKSKAPIDLAIEKALKNKKKFNESRFLGGIKYGRN